MTDSSELPIILDSPVKMDEANQHILIYEGIYILKTETDEIKINGEIKFTWFPNSGAKFTGLVLDIALQSFKDIQEQTVKVKIGDFIFGEGFITNTTIDDQIKISGSISQLAISGDKSITVSKITFGIPNFREFLGYPVRNTTSIFSSYKNRLIFETDKYLINIDKRINFEHLSKSLQEKGGYILTHAGELIPKKGSISYDDSKEIFHCLDTFLSFLNGKRTSAIFLNGVFNEDVLWQDFTDYNVDIYGFSASWPAAHDITGLNELWQVFYKIWTQDKEDKNFLISAIHWYIEANNSSGYTEGAITMAQTALELLYNWFVLEQKKLIIGKDSENINAANKIRLLLSQLNIDHSVPDKFKNLQAFLNDSIQPIDAPEAIVQIRNAIVHSQEEKRKKLSEINFRAKYEALQLCIWYIEMTLLKILGHNGKYANRCSSNMSTSGKTEIVPLKK